MYNNLHTCINIYFYVCVSPLYTWKLNYDNKMFLYCYQHTARSLAKALHHNVKLWKCQYTILILVKQHKNFLKIRYLFLSQLPFGLESEEYYIPFIKSAKTMHYMRTILVGLVKFWENILVPENSSLRLSSVQNFLQ